MNPRGRVVGLCGMLLATTGCVQKIDLDITAVELVESLPGGKTNIQGQPDPRAGNPKVVEAGLVKVQFRTRADLRHEAAEHNTSAYVRPCGPRSNEGPDFIEPSSIFADDDGGYTAFFPARLDLFVRQDPEGGLKLGWPETTLASGVCFQVSGLDMLHFGLQSDEIRLDRMTELLKQGETPALK